VFQEDSCHRNMRDFGKTLITAVAVGGLFEDLHLDRTFGLACYSIAAGSIFME
jgi:hypothetical protein